MTTDPADRSIFDSPYPGPSFDSVGEIFLESTNPGRKKPFAIRAVVEAVIDADGGALERWQPMDPAGAAVVYDAADAALARKVDVLIIDTAGRLQTKENLMAELGKIGRVAAKKIDGAPHEVLLVLDATTGQNAISQARHFGEATNVTGIFLSKLDGTAKGGIVVAIKEKLEIPVKFMGLGETAEDIAPFLADEFVEALFS